MHIEKITKNDIEPIVSLVMALFPEKYPDHTAGSGLVRRLFNSNNCAIMKGSHEGCLIALAMYEVIASDWYGGQYMYIHLLGIAKEYQRQGFGRQLIQFLHTLAQKADYLGIQLDSGFQRESAQAFYENSGFAKVGILFNWRNQKTAL